MGNKIKASQKNQASQALPGGETGFGKNVSQSSSKPIKIRLIQLNQLLTGAVSTGQAVTVKWKVDGFYCFIKNQQLGKIPANYNDKFSDSVSYRGRIVDVKPEPFSVTIEVSI